MSKAWSEGQATESSGAESPEGDDPMACAKAKDTKETKKLVQSRSRRCGQKSLDVIDRMKEETDLFAKQWTEPQSLIANPEKVHRLSEVIKVFYGEMDHKACKKREELQGRDQAHPPQEKENATGVKATTLDDLQGSLALTIKKICKCAKGVPDEDEEEKCKRAEEFLEEVLSEFKRMHFDLCNSTPLAELLDKSSKPEQAWELLGEMEKSAEGDHQTRIQHQGDDPYSLKGLIASKRKQLDKRLERVDNNSKETIEKVQRLQSQLAPYLREEQIQQSHKDATRQLAALWKNKMNQIQQQPLGGDFTTSAQYFCLAVQEWTTQMVEAGHWEENRVEEIFTEFCDICGRFQSPLVALAEELIISTDCSSAPVGTQTVPHLQGGLNYDGAV